MPSSEIRAICPQCSSLTQSGRVNGKFYVNTDSLLGYCHHCGFKGKFKPEILEQVSVVAVATTSEFKPPKLEPLSPEAKRYLAKRFPGVELDQLDAFGLSYHNQRHAIAIPSYNPNTKLLQGVKYRLLASKDQRYTAEPGSEFGGYWLSGKIDKLLIVEGEFDAISARLAGFGGTILALQTNKLSEDSVNRIRQFQNVFLCLDSDSGGQEGLKTIEAVLQNVIKPITLKLPESAKDLNELFQLGGIYAVDKFLRSETKTEIEKATRRLSDCIPEMLEFLSDVKNTRGLATGFNRLDDVLGGGFRPAEMTVVNAFAKTGKTSFINNIIHNLAERGQRIGVASFEMDPARMLYPSLMSIAAKVNIRTLGKEKLAEAIRIISENHSYLSNIITFQRFGYTPWKEVEAWARLMKDEHAIEFLVLDHAGFLVEDMTDAKENQILAKSIKELTNTTGLHIITVVQAPKTKDGLSIQTAYGGMAWGQNTDNFITLERDKTEENKNYVRLEAARYPGAKPSNTPVIMYYDHESCVLSEG